MRNPLPDSNPVPTSPPAADYLPATGLTLGFLALYVRTLCPTVYLGDSGEITTAIASGGVVHPPGYPLYTVLGRMALWLVPTGEPAFRVGCVTAFFAALVVGGLYRLVRELGTGRVAAALAAAGYGVSYTFWSQSTRVEVYSLHVFLAVLTLIGAVRYGNSGRRRDLCLTVAAGSLGLAHHLTLVLLAPGLLLICGARLWTDPGRGRRFAAALPLLLLGPLHWLLLLMWARAEPPQAWGRTVTLPLLWNHLSARIYRGALRIPEWDYFSARAAQTLAVGSDSFPWGLFVLPVAGFVLLWRAERRAAAGLLLIAMTTIAFNQCYHIADIAPYFLPALLILAVVTGVGLDRLTRAIPRGYAAGVLGAAALLLVAAPLARNWEACDLSDAVWVREFARHKLESAPPNAVLITHEDPDTFPVWYAHQVLGIRPDVTPVDYGLLRSSVRRYARDPSQWYLHHVRRLGLDVPLDYPKEAAALRRLDQDAFIFAALFRSLGERPVCLTFLMAAQPRHPLMGWLQERYESLPLGIVLWQHPRSEPIDPVRLLHLNRQRWAAITPPDVGTVRVDQEMYPQYTLHHYACMLVNYGGLYERLGQREPARLLYEQARLLAPAYLPAEQAAAALSAPVADP